MLNHSLEAAHLQTLGNKALSVSSFWRMLQRSGRVSTWSGKHPPLKHSAAWNLWVQHSAKITAKEGRTDCGIKKTHGRVIPSARWVQWKWLQAPQIPGLTPHQELWAIGLMLHVQLLQAFYTWSSESRHQHLPLDKALAANKIYKNKSKWW